MTTTLAKFIHITALTHEWFVRELRLEPKTYISAFAPHFHRRLATIILHFLEPGNLGRTQMPCVTEKENRRIADRNVGCSGQSRSRRR